MVESFGILIVGGTAAVVTGALLGLPRWWRVLGVLALVPFAVLMLFCLLATMPPCVNGPQCTADQPAHLAGGLVAMGLVGVVLLVTAWRTHQAFTGRVGDGRRTGTLV